MWPKYANCSQLHLFSFAGQFKTTVMGDVFPCRTGVLIKNRCPSRLTSYITNSDVATGTFAFTWNSDTGTPTSNPAPALTGAALNFPSVVRKYNSFPSSLHRGCSPPRAEHTSLRTGSRDHPYHKSGNAGSTRTVEPVLPRNRMDRRAWCDPTKTDS